VNGASPGPLRGDGRVVRIVHLFPDLLSVYGDAGNVRALVVRAEARQITVTRATVLADDDVLPSGDLFVIGGGQDRDQMRVAGRLRRLGAALEREVGDGAALLAICGGYQSLGTSYRSVDGSVMAGPGLLDVATVGAPGRLVGPVVARLEDPALRSVRDTIVGFENHSGRTELGDESAPLARIEVGHGNNDHDGTEGVLEATGVRGLAGLRIGTYLHGPFLPRNPHIADALLRAALARTGQPVELAAIDDAAEWRAHDAHLARCRRRPVTARLPSRVRRLIEPLQGLVGF
jgi:CobQ-like glutamine amidotransferase family enzyme